MEVRINKEVRDYQESIFFGLSLRQLLFALLAVLVAVIRSELLYPRKLVFKSENLYAKAMENSTIKEGLRLD